MPLSAHSLPGRESQGTFLNAGPGEGSLTNYRIVSIPDYPKGQYARPAMRSDARRRSGRFLRVESLAPREHLHELFDTALARFRSLGVTDPIEDGVAVLAA
jgi:hypothetical protein